MRVFFILFVLCSVLSLNAAKLYYSNGTFEGMQKAEGYSAALNGISKGIAGNPVIKMNVGNRNYSVYKDAAGSLPVYFLGKYPVIADNLLFWRGTRSVSEMEKQYGLKLVEILDDYELYSFRVLSGDSVETAEKIVNNGDGYAFPNLIRQAVLRYTPAQTPEDPYFNMQWHLANTGSVVNYNLETVKLKKGSDIKFLQMLKFLSDIKFNVDDSIKVAIMDTGVVPDHPDLTNIETGYDAIEDKEGGNPDTSTIADLQWYEVASVAHGTTCAGVSAGVGNGIGMSGVCPWCKIYPVRYLDGLNGTAMDDAVMLKVYEKYVADPKISAINCSFGPTSEYGNVPTTPGEIEAIGNFMQNGRGGLGGVVVYASGNDGVDAGYEKLMETEFNLQRNGLAVKGGVISVAATSPWDTRVTYSNYGPSIDIAAPSLEGNPAVGIATATIPGYGDYQNDYTLMFSGTSAAAPVVTGFFGTIFSINPELTLEEAVEIMKQSSDKVYPETGSWDENGHSVKFGWGRVNLLKAARLAMNLEMCFNPAENEICGNNTDDNCDGFVDEGCEPELIAGTPCENAADCLSGDLTEADAECLKTLKYWIFKEGYCVRKTNNAPCPDGTKAFEYTSDGKNYLCAVECSVANPCKREKYYCSNNVLGICLPKCQKDSDCNAGSYCNVDAQCDRLPSSLGGPCEDDSECISPMWCLPYFDEGYCTADCAPDDDSTCPDGGRCVTRKSGGSQNTNMCLSSCDSDSDCRNNDYYICHARMNEKTGMCFRKCRNDADCMDVDATCNTDGRCVPAGWTGWPGDDTGDTDAVDNDITDGNNDSENTDSETTDTSEPEKKSGDSGCAVTTF